MVKARIVDLPKPGVVVASTTTSRDSYPSASWRAAARRRRKIQIGEELELRVIRVDLEHRRIALSERALHTEEEPVEERAAAGTARGRERERGRERHREEDLNDRFTLEDHLREFEEERDLDE